MELVEQNKYFDNRYLLSNQGIEFMNLLEFANKNKFIDDGYKELIVNSYKDAIYNQIMATYDFDMEDDYTQKLTELTSRYYLALNDYLKGIGSPYQALNEVLKNSPRIIICNSFDRFNYFDKQVNKKIVSLKNKSTLLIDNNFEYGQFIKYITNYLSLLGNKQLLYPTMDNNSVKDLTTLEQVDKVLDEYILESDILNKFDQREILILLKKILYSEDYKGVATIAMYNYVFNDFFKDSSSILLTDNMRKIVIEGIQNNFYSINDVINVIENGTIKYTDEEKEYLINNFVPAFNDEIINKKNYIPYIKIK